jgi:nicotinate-nucleotide adenylyltransferase
MGSDSFQNISRWKNYEQLLNNYSFYVYSRPGFEVKSTDKNVLILKAPLLEISSTQLRNAIKEGKPIRYLVPESVREEIERNGYYKNGL